MIISHGFNGNENEPDSEPSHIIHVVKSDGKNEGDKNDSKKEQLTHRKLDQVDKEIKNNLDRMEKIWKKVKKNEEFQDYITVGLKALGAIFLLLLVIPILWKCSASENRDSKSDEHELVAIPEYDPVYSISKHSRLHDIV